VKVGHGPSAIIVLALAATVDPHVSSILGDPAGVAGEATLQTDRPQRAGQGPRAGLTGEDWRQMRRAVQDSSYRASRVARRNEAPALRAANRQQGYATTFRREGIEIVPARPAGSWRLGLSVTGYGYEGDLLPIEPAEPRAEKERVEYRRGRVTEWYANQPGGLEQGFELGDPRPGRRGPLVVAMAVRGDLGVSGGGDAALIPESSRRTVT
jgi:hypothetical protein